MVCRAFFFRCLGNRIWIYLIKTVKILSFVKSEIKPNGNSLHFQIEANTRITGSSTVDPPLWGTLGLYSKPNSEYRRLCINQPVGTWSEVHLRLLILPLLLIWIRKLLTACHSLLSSFTGGHRKKYINT